VTAQADYRIIIKKWYFAAIAAAVLAGSVFLFGMRVSGTDDTAWITLPFGMTVQPSEFIKPCFIITFTYHICLLKEKNLLQKPWAVLTLLLHAALPIAVIHFQGDDGTALVFGIVFPVMMLLGGVKLRYFAILGGIAAAGLPLVWRYVMNDAQKNRLLSLFDAENTAMADYAYQQYPGRLSLASGGLFGTGWLNGKRVASAVVPEQENDFILTVAGEELGFLGCLTIIALLFAIMLIIILNSKKATTNEGSLICAGAFAVIAAQAVLNLGMVLGLLPVIGVTLPFFSAGGSSLISTFICIGLVQSVRIHKY
jgi:rod shape determining protein RodA